MAGLVTVSAVGVTAPGRALVLALVAGGVTRKAGSTRATAAALLSSH